MRRKLLIVLISCTTILLIGAFSASGQEKEVDLKDRSVTIKMDKQPLASVFSYLMKNYEVPIGFEESILDRQHNDYAFDTNLPGVGIKKLQTTDLNGEITFEAWNIYEAKQHWITINVENQRLENVLNIIVRQMANYKWEINDGVVNTYPTRGRDQRYEKLLELHINNFTLEKGKAVKEITTNIIELPEFKKFMDENKLHFTGLRAGADILVRAQYGRKLDAEMNFSNLTFRDLLNKITKIKRGGWILKWKGSRSGEEHIDVDI